MDLSRRELGRLLMLAAGAGPAGVFLNGCSEDGVTSAGKARVGSSTTVGSTTPVDPTRPWWLQGGYAPVTEEVTHDELEVRGSLPSALAGLYVKNTSNPHKADSPHWFFGDGMVHGIRLAGGSAEWYRNRYVATDPYREDRSFGTGMPGGANNQSNVSCVFHGGRLLTSGEVGMPFELDPRDLSTKGVVDFAGKLTGSFTAHPKIDPVTGRMHSFGYGFFDPFLQYHVTEPDGTMSHVETVPIPRSTMMHDFAITETDVVFWDLPVVFDMDRAIAMTKDPVSGILPFVWQPEAGARLGVMPLGGGADAIAWFDIDPCFAFHGVNAFRRGDDIIVDICRLESAFAGNYDGPGFTGPATLRRWTIDTAGGKVSDEILEAESPGDLPTRDPRRVGREHRYGYLAATRLSDRTIDFGGVIKHDFREGSRETWDPGPTRHAGEPLFVPGDPADDADDAGWLLTIVHDEAVGESVLAVLDATEVTAGPVGEIVLPQRVPYGFHATWVADDAV